MVVTDYQPACDGGGEGGKEAAVAPLATKACSPVEIVSDAAFDDLEYDFKDPRGDSLTPDEVWRRCEHFPRCLRLPIWKASWGELLVRLPAAPTPMQQLLVFSPQDYLPVYVDTKAVTQTQETDAVLTATARIYYLAEVTRKHPTVRRAVRASLLRDYHPDKLGGDAELATIVNYIQTKFASD